MELNEKIVSKYPETTIDPMIDISDTKMYGTGMWFNTPADVLYEEHCILSDVDLTIKANDVLLGLLNGDRPKTLEELKAERLRQLEMEE